MIFLERTSEDFATDLKDSDFLFIDERSGKIHKRKNRNILSKWYSFFLKKKKILTNFKLCPGYIFKCIILLLINIDIYISIDIDLYLSYTALCSVDNI